LCRVVRELWTHAAFGEPDLGRIGDRPVDVWSSVSANRRRGIGSVLLAGAEGNEGGSVGRAAIRIDSTGTREPATQPSEAVQGAYVLATTSGGPATR
jgi:hypothetical protein